jgi:hypothetical protein
MIQRTFTRMGTELPEHLAPIVLIVPGCVRGTLRGLPGPQS